MDNEIFRTTLSDRKFASFYNIDEGEKKRYGVLFATFFSNLVLTGVLLSYGIIVSIRLSSGVAIYELLLAPGIFCVSRSLADPWFRDAADSWKNGITSRTLAFCGVFICCLGVATSTVAGSQVLHAVSFGLLGGIGSSLVISQIDFVITDLFQVNINRVRLLGQYGQALGQCTMPYLVMVLFHFYGHSMGYLLLSCSVLQLLPVILFLKTTTIQQPKALSQQRSYVRAYSLFEDDTSVASGLNDVQLVDLSKKSWKSPSDENLAEQTEEFEEDPDVEEYENVNETTAAENKSKNLYGVDILPQILEESENSDTDGEENDSSDSHKSGTVKIRDKKKVNDDIKRLSVISDKLDEIIIKSEISEPSEGIKNNLTKMSDGVSNLSKMGDGKSEYSIVRRTSNSMDWLNDTSHLEYSRNTLPDFRCCCSSYSCYRTKRKFRNAFDYLRETFIKPLKLALKTIQFYPALLLKVCSVFIPCCLSSLAALLANEVKPILSIAELGFVLSVHGIAWLAFLILFPWMTAIPKSKYKYIAAFGCFASAFGSFVLMDSNVFEFISIGSAIAGVGYGAILASCEETMRNCIGLRKWSKLRGSLDCLAGFITALLVAWMSYLLTTENGLAPCFGVLIGLHSLSGLIWVVIPLVVVIRKHHNVQHLWPEA